MQVNITQLITYPIKSCAGIPHETVVVNHLGLLGDRQWMLVDEQGLFLSQRKFPAMALIQPTLTADGLSVAAPGMPNLTIEHNPQAKPMAVTVWKNTLTAEAISQQADHWFSQYLTTKCHLVYYGTNSHRPIDPDFAHEGETVAFADGYPVLVTHEATLNNLNQQLNAAVDIGRFRSNVVVSSEFPAWHELTWHGLSCPALNLSLVKPCSRCVMTGVEQTTGKQTGTEVLKTLKRDFAYQNKAVFGINAIPQLTGAKAELSVGMTLTVNSHSS